MTPGDMFLWPLVIIGWSVLCFFAGIRYKPEANSQSQVICHGIVYTTDTHSHGFRGLVEKETILGSHWIKVTSLDDDTTSMIPVSRVASIYVPPPRSEK